MGGKAWATSRARVVAAEDTVDGIFDDLQRELKLDQKALPLLMPRMQGAIADLRIVKDPAEIELMCHA